MRRGIIHIHSSLNNTILSLTDLDGCVQAWVSCGSIGFKKKTRSTSYAAQAAGEALGRLALKRGFLSVIVHLKGLGQGRDSGCRGLAMGGLKILQIKEKTRLPHNGCRAPKKRRL